MIRYHLDPEERSALRSSFSLERNVRVNAKLILLSSLVGVGAIACGSSETTVSGAKPSKVTQPVHVETDATRAVAACEKAAEREGSIAYGECLTEDAVYIDNTGALTKGRGDSVGSLGYSPSLTSGARRLPIVLLADRTQVFELWIETGTASGVIEGQEVRRKPYGVLGATWWRDFDGHGRFASVRHFVDPNMFLHQVGKAALTSRDPMTLPSSPPQRAKIESSDTLPPVVTERAKAVNAHDLAALEATFSMQVISVNTGSIADVEGRDELLASVPSSWSMYPDVSVTIDESLVGQDLVVATGRFSGTRASAIVPGAPERPTFELPYLEVMEITDGKISKIWRIADSLSVPSQIGMVEVERRTWVGADE